jgi:hypothetical protein
LSLRTWPGDLKVASAPATAAAPATTTATPATAAAAPTTAATTVSATAAAGSSSTATTAAIVGLGTRFVHHDRPAHYVFSVKRGNGLLEFRIIRNFHESESAGLAG